MRIVCPKCVAQYEVDESAIPEQGREVQCANCEHIWFQDYIDMLPERIKADAEAGEDRIFDGLDKAEAEFHSARATPELDDDDDAYDNILADDDDDDDIDDGEDQHGSAAPVLPPVADDVRELLKTEAAFSAASADDDTPKDDSASDGVAEDDLAAFLEAHSEPQDADAQDAAGSDIPDTGDAPDDGADDAIDDPLADLDAMRNQLDQIGAGSDLAEDASDDDAEQADDDALYTPVVPMDDPVAVADEPDIEDPVEAADADAGDSDATSEAIAAALDGAQGDDIEDDVVYDDPIEAAEDAASTHPAVDSDDDFDDFDDTAEQPRHAYRADGLTGDDHTDVSDSDDDDGAADTADADDAEQPDADVEDDVLASLRSHLDDGGSDEATDGAADGATDPAEDTSGDATGPATAAAATGAALGISRPRGKGRVRARTIPGFEPPAPPEKTEDPEPLADEQPLDQSEVDHARRPDRPRAPRRLVMDDADDLSTSEVASAAEVEPETDIDTDADTPDAAVAEQAGHRFPDVDEVSDALADDTAGAQGRSDQLAGGTAPFADAVEPTGGGGFRRALIWTLFIIALLIALYVMRPQIVAAVPALAIVLDPYASVIDQLRLMIDGLIAR